MEIINTSELVDELLAKAAASKAMRAAQALRSARENQMRHTAIALVEGATLAEHDNPGEATLLVLRGSVRLTAGEDSWNLHEGDYGEIPQMKHGLEALVDSVVLLNTVNN